MLAAKMSNHIWNTLITFNMSMPKQWAKSWFVVPWDSFINISTYSSAGDMPEPTLPVLATTCVSLLTKLSKTLYGGSPV